MNKKLDRAETVSKTIKWLMLAIIFCIIWFVGLWHAGKAVIKFFGG